MGGLLLLVKTAGNSAVFFGITFSITNTIRNLPHTVDT
nr:MAG TPA: hypothetical protein [Caudoviricetes sp.]